MRNQIIIFHKLTILLDESGSMYPNKRDVLGLLKNIIQAYKCEIELLNKGDKYFHRGLFTLMFFSNKIVYKFNDNDIQDVEEIVDYNPDNGTRLFDAVCLLEGIKYRGCYNLTIQADIHIITDINIVGNATYGDDSTVNTLSDAQKHIDQLKLSGINVKCHCLTNQRHSVGQMMNMSSHNYRPDSGGIQQIFTSISSTISCDPSIKIDEVIDEGIYEGGISQSISFPVL